MKYISIDIETAGLGRDCSILEFGAVCDDLWNIKPYEELPKFHCYFTHDKIVGEPFALGMHKTILQRIAKREEPYKYINTCALGHVFGRWLISECGYKPFKRDAMCEHVEITVAGKNYAMFDKDFLAPLFDVSGIHVHRRVIDPAILFFNLGKDEVLPGSKECLQRAKLDGEVAHTALEDAMMVVKLLRHHFYHRD